MIERNFSSAHQLRGYKGKCENLHGHNYKIEIYARGRELNNIGLLVDFVELKEAADEIRNHDQYDYILVNHQVEESVGNLAAIVKAERVRRFRMEEKIRPILESFEARHSRI